VLLRRKELGGGMQHTARQFEFVSNPTLKVWFCSCRKRNEDDDIRAAK
jgi:hypothetical protein